ncbi:hypothetical protein BJ322DRAFT_1012935, partial [Thelephora terrestris]
TTSIYVSLEKFSEANHGAQNHLVTIGAGLIWDDVYAALDHLAVLRAVWVDVSTGCSSGYSYGNNQYGLVVDNVLAHNLPDGTIVTAFEDESPELFWALKVQLSCNRLE